MKKSILDQEKINPSQKGALARAKKYAEMKSKVCTSCENEFPIEKMQKGRTKCKECFQKAGKSSKQKKKEVNI